MIDSGHLLGAFAPTSAWHWLLDGRCDSRSQRTPPFLSLSILVIERGKYIIPRVRKKVLTRQVFATIAVVKEWWIITEKSRVSQSSQEIEQTDTASQSSH